MWCWVLCVMFGATLSKSHAFLSSLFPFSFFSVCSASRNPLENVAKILRHVFLLFSILFVAVFLPREHYPALPCSTLHHPALPCSTLHYPATPHLRFTKYEIIFTKGYLLKYVVIKMSCWCVPHAKSQMCHVRLPLWEERATSGWTDSLSATLRGKEDRT